MRLLSVGLIHETNTFAQTPTRLSDFVEASGGDPAFPSDLILKRFAGTETIHGGYLEAAAASGITLVPLFHAEAVPSGVIDESAYRLMKNELVGRLKKALPADGILLDLHGAMVTQEHEDAEGDLAAAVRALVGRSVPIIMTLDLHANITPQMAAHVDAIIGYDTYPHCDMGDRGREAVELMARIVAGSAQPTMALVQLPLITMPPRQCTLREPMQTILARLHALEQEPGVLTATLACGFPFADIRDAGVAVVVVTDGDAGQAQARSLEFADYVFSRRDEFDPELTCVREAIRYAREKPRGRSSWRTARTTRAAAPLAMAPSFFAN